MIKYKYTQKKQKYQQNTKNKINIIYKNSKKSTTKNTTK